MKKAGRFALILLCAFPLMQSCSINRMAINAISNALTGEGSADVFTSDPDPELVGAALPFAIKMYETLLAQNPNHQGLLLTTGSLFIMYANAFVQGPAEMLDPVFYFEERIAAFDRAKQLYLRGYAILTSALEKRFPGFSEASIHDGTLQGFLSRLRRQDVPLIYWTVAGGLAAYSIDIFDFALGARVPDWAAMMNRAYELYPDFNYGAINEFFILFYASLPEELGGDINQAKIHFERALRRSNFMNAGPYLAFAQAIAIPAQDYQAFRENLLKALAIDPDANPSTRLINILAQRRARFLMEISADIF